MEKLICESTYFYGSYEENPQTYRVKFRLKDYVDGELLQKAAELAIKRYPYYAVKCSRTEQEYVLEKNDEPFVVYRTGEPIELGGEASNGYLLAISYWEDLIWLNVFHGLADGCGTMRFMRTLLYYYCQQRYDSSLPADGVQINDGSIPQSEWDNPYIKIMSGERRLPDEDEIAVKVKTPSNSPALSLFDDSRITLSSRKCYQLRLSEKQVIQYCRTQDGTPGVLFSLLMSRAIDKLNPQNERPIISGMAMNLRPALNAPMYKGSSITLAYLPYSGKIKDKPFAQQATAFRGKLLLLSDHNRLLAGIKNSAKLYSAIAQIPTVEGKKQFMQKLMSSYKNTSTFGVSYVGPAKLGAAERYVTETEVENAGESIFIEVTAVNGSFFLNITQQWQENLYFDAFCEELSAIGFEYELLYCGEQKVTKVNLP